jgi:excisionase family DNA binding protein
MPRLLKVPTVAAYLGVSRMTVYRMIERQELESVRLGQNTIRVTAGSVQDMLAARTTARVRL